MRNMKRLVVLGMALALALPIPASTVFQITVREGLDKERKGVGIAVAERTLLTSHGLVQGNGQSTVLDPASSAELVATVKASDKDAGLALLSVPGLEAEPVTLAVEPPQAGRRAEFRGPDGTSRSGTVHSVATLPNGQVQYRFTMAVEPSEAAAPMLNNCGELLAVGLDKQEERNLWTTGSLPATRAFLEAEQVSFESAAAACASITDRLKAAEESSKELREQQTAVEAEKDQIAQEKAAVEQQLKELEEAIAESQQRTEAEKQEAEKQRQTLEQRRTELEGQLQGRSRDLAAKQKQLDELEGERAGLEEQVRELEGQNARKDEALSAQQRAQEEDRRAFGLLGAALGVLVLLGMVFGFAQLRARRRERIEAGKAVAGAKAELARREATFSDVVLTGQDADGNEVRVKVNGNALAQAEAGQVIGRSSAEADYVVATESVSRRHARIAVADGGLQIEDLGSLNGTLLDGTPMQPRTAYGVRPGSRITLGDVELLAAFLDRERP